MKNTVGFLFSLLLFSVCAFAQDETYTKIYDEPADIIKGHIGVELYSVDVGFKNISGAMIFGVGANAHYPITKQLAAEGAFRFPLLRLEKSGGSYMFDGGVVLSLSSHSSDKEVKVILSYKEEDKLDKRVATVRYVNVQAKVVNTLVARGGVYLKNTAFEYSEGTTDYKTTNVFHKGIYFGIGNNKQWLVNMQRNPDGDKFAAGSYFRPYADVLILPTSVDLTQDTFGMGAGVSKEVKGLLGARVGMKWYRNPFTRKQNYDRRLGFFGNCTMMLEGGYRPLEGMFITGGISYMVHKFI